MLDVVVVGAGITGLAAAISLRRVGHKVTIYERSSGNNEIGAAINVPPNVGPLLVRWGLDPAKGRFVISKCIHFFAHDTLDMLLSHDHSHDAETFGAPLYYAHRVDLHSALRALATGPEGPGVPAEVKLKSVVVDFDSDTPAVTLSDGSIITADVVVAADGVHSRAVGAVMDEPILPRPAKRFNCCYRFLIPRTLLEADQETRFFTQGPEALGGRVWAHPVSGQRLVSYPCRDYEILNFVGIYLDENLTETKEDWHATVDKSEVLTRFGGFSPHLLAVINKATDVKRWPLLYRPPIPTWTKGKMVLAGDAAHPMLPHYGQGGAQGIEDGIAIGLVLAGATPTSDLRQRLAVYERVRRNRAASIQILSSRGFDQPAPPELEEFLDGMPVPNTSSERIHFAYDHDVAKAVVREMKALDPSFRMPSEFFNDASSTME